MSMGDTYFFVPSLQRPRAASLPVSDDQARPSSDAHNSSIVLYCNAVCFETEATERETPHDHYYYTHMAHRSLLLALLTRQSDNYSSSCLQLLYRHGATSAGSPLHGRLCVRDNLR